MNSIEASERPVPAKPFRPSSHAPFSPSPNLSLVREVPRNRSLGGMNSAGPENRAVSPPPPPARRELDAARTGAAGGEAGRVQRAKPRMDGRRRRSAATAREATAGSVGQ